MMEFCADGTVKVMLQQLSYQITTSHYRHNRRDGVSNHRRLDCLLNCLFRSRSKKTSKLRVTGLCEGNSPVTGEFPVQRASNAKTFPCNEMASSLTTVFRKGNTNTAENYRLISLTCVSCKLFEHIICHHIHDHLDRHSIFRLCSMA